MIMACITSDDLCTVSLAGLPRPNPSGILNAGEPGLVCRARLSIYGTTLLKQIQSNESRSAKEENEAGIQYVQDVSGSRVQVIRRCENDVDAQMQRKILVGTKNE